jgi:hypothetical protein
MKIKFYSIWLFFVAAILALKSISLSQVVTHNAAGYGIEPVKGVSLSVAIETNAIIGVSTNVLRCRLVNTSTNTIRGLKSFFSVEFKNKKGGKTYRLPTFESVEMTPTADQPLNRAKFEQLKPGQICEWNVYFSTGHPFELVRIPARDATNENAKIYYSNLNSMRLVQIPGDYQIKVEEFLVTVPDEYGGGGYYHLDSNSLEIQVAD